MGVSFSARKRRQEKLKELIDANKPIPHPIIEEESEDESQSSKAESRKSSKSSKSKRKSRIRKPSGTSKTSKTEEISKFTLNSPSTSSNQDNQSYYSSTGDEESSTYYDMDKETYKRYADSSVEEVSTLKNTIKDIPNNYNIPKKKKKKKSVRTVRRPPVAQRFKKKKHTVKTMGKKAEDSGELERLRRKIDERKERLEERNRKRGKVKEDRGREEQRPVKEDSFFKNFDASNLDFSKELEKSYLRYKEGNEKRKDEEWKDGSKLFIDLKVEEKKPKFRDKSRLEISPITSDNDGSEEEEVITEEKIEEKIEKNRQKNYSLRFNWGDSGKVELRSLKYWIEYSPKLRGFKLKKSDNCFLVTELAWNLITMDNVTSKSPKKGKNKRKNSQKMELYEFNLQDKKLINFVSSKTKSLKMPEMRFLVDKYGNFLESLNSKEIAYDIVQRKRKQNLVKRPNEKEKIIDKKIWKKNLKIVKENLDSNLRKIWKKILEDWSCYIEGGSMKTEDSDRYHDSFKDVKHLGEECLELARGDMEQGEDIEYHISKKVVDEHSYRSLKKSKHFIIDPLNAWGLRGETKKIINGRRKAREMGSIDDFLNTEQIKDFIRFFATDKYNIKTTILEQDTLKPHIVNSHKATRLVFETYDGAFVQIEEEKELTMFLWKYKDGEKISLKGSKKLEEYFYKEASKFRADTKKLFVDIMANLLKLRSAPLKCKLDLKKQIML